MNLGIIQVRMGSVRLPGKVLKEIQGKPILELLLDRLAFSTKLDQIIIATTKNIEDNVINEICNGFTY